MTDLRCELSISDRGFPVSPFGQSRTGASRGDLTDRQRLGMLSKWPAGKAIGRDKTRRLESRRHVTHRHAQTMALCNGELNTLGTSAHYSASSGDRHGCPAHTPLTDSAYCRQE